jgi:hypothetical protein
MTTTTIKKTEPKTLEECTTCKCGNCTAAPGVDPNESCCFCNGSYEEEEVTMSDVPRKYIGAINRINNHQFLAITGGGVGMGVFMTDQIYESFTTEAEAEEMVKKLVAGAEPGSDKWERLTEEQIKATGIF